MSTKNVKTPAEAIEIAVKAFNNGQRDLAQTICEQVVQFRPNFSEAHFIIGMVHLRKAAFAEAEVELRDAIYFGGPQPRYLAALAELAKRVPASRIWSLQSLLRGFYKTNLLVIHYLELDIAHACNLKCPGCTHYSNYGVKGVVPFAEGGRWMEEWTQRLFPTKFRILGGEPTINPELCDYIRKARQLWPASMCELVTNGFFIDRHPDLFRTLAETNTSVQLSLHENGEDYLQKANFEKLKAASKAYGFALHTLAGTANDFWQPYLGEGETMMPFAENDYETSFAICGGCASLAGGKLWKCPNIAHLHLADGLFNLSKKPEWQPYTSHAGVVPQLSDLEMLDYLYKPHPICGMCPTRHQSMTAALGGLASLERLGSS
jgi:hypothetical protein